MGQRYDNTLSFFTQFEFSRRNLRKIYVDFTNISCQCLYGVMV